MNDPKLKILIVDDEPDIARVMRSLLENTHIVILAHSSEEALPLIDIYASELVCIVSDFKMSDMNGMDLRRTMLKKHKDIPFILLSGYVTRDDALAAIDAKISAFESKPFDHRRILETIKRVSADRESSIRERLMLERTFVDEATTICEELEPLIMSLEANPTDTETINTIFRLVHTIKGSSGVLESTHIRTYVHRYEDLLSKLKSMVIHASPDIISILLQGLDVVNRMIAHLRSGKSWEEDVEHLIGIFAISSKVSVKDMTTAVASNFTGNTANPISVKDTVSVPTAMLDQFMEQSGEITVIRNMVNKLLRAIEKDQPGNKNIQQLSELLDEMHKINGSMQGRLSETRKVPCSKVLRSIPRIVRDTASALGKKATLTVFGDETRIDTAIAKVLSDSMTHIVRNSLDHGIELPEKREAKGKSKEGSLRISVVEHKDEIIVTIEDDGAGLNIDRIKKKAIENGLYKEEELIGMSDKHIFGLIFESGFSTAEKITDVSGRGVGMDMVRSAVQSLRGFIDIESMPDVGTKFHLHLPVPRSVLIINSLSVIACGLSFAIPQERITRLLHFEGKSQSELILKIGEDYVIPYEGTLIPVIDLGAVLNLRDKSAIKLQSMESVNVLVINTSDQYYALYVDQILDSEEIVVKSAGRHLAHLKVYMGATFMADGNVGLILNTDGIAEVANVGSLSQAVVESRGKTEELPRYVATTEYLVFKLAELGKFAVPLNLVHRLEEIPQSAIQNTGSRQVAIYRDQVIPLVNLCADLKVCGPDRNASASDAPGNLSLNIFVTLNKNQYVGFVIKSICDISAVQNEKYYDLSDRPEIEGTLDVSGDVVSVLDLDFILKSHNLTTFLEDIKSTKDQFKAEKIQIAEVEEQGWGVF